MGWNFGGVIIDFDFHTVVDELLEPELRQFRTGAETPEEAQAKARIDMGAVALRVLGIAAVPADAPVSFADAANHDFDDYAVGTSADKTVVVGRSLGRDQCSPELVATFEQISRERGAVLALWFNDASDTRIVSFYRDGRRIHLRSSGPGLDDERPEVAGEHEAAEAHDREIPVLEAFVGQPFTALLELRLERFMPC